MADRKAVIKNADMSEDMQQDAIDCATQALEKYNIEKDIAAFIKKEFDKKYNPTWHCIVGRNFGSCAQPPSPSRPPPPRADGCERPPPIQLFAFTPWRSRLTVEPCAVPCRRDSRDEALHLLLLGPGRHPALQVWLDMYEEAVRRNGCKLVQGVETSCRYFLRAWAARCARALRMED